MIDVKFIYKTPKGKIKNNISIESEDRESAIAIFEEDYPNYKWFKTEII